MPRRVDCFRIGSRFNCNCDSCNDLAAFYSFDHTPEPGQWEGNEQYGAGKYNEAALFDHASIVTGPPPYTDLIRDLSITFWVKLNYGYSANFVALKDTYSEYNPPGERHLKIQFYTQDDTVRVYVKDDVAHEQSLISSVSLSLDKWYYIALTKRADGHTELYIYDEQGLLDHVGDDLDYFTTPIDALYIGADKTNNGAIVTALEGLIDHMKFFNHCLTDAEVEADWGQ